MSKIQQSAPSDLRSEDGPPTSAFKDYGAQEEFPDTAQVSSPLLTGESAESIHKKPEKKETNPRWKYAIFGRLTLVGYVLGLGNIVIFPDMYFRNGRCKFWFLCSSNIGDCISSSLFDSADTFLHLYWNAGVLD